MSQPSKEKEMKTRVSSEHLRRLRNEIKVAELITRHLDLPTKVREGYLRFLCPRCQEFNTAVNPRTNLGRCFRCEKNFNTIDFVVEVFGCPFLEAVRYLEVRFPPSKRRGC